MKTYLINTFNRVSTTGHHLDFISTIKSQEWVVVNDDTSYVEKFLFLENNKLLVSINGKSSYSKWEYIKANYSLVIDDGNSKYLFKIIVCNKDLIVLNIDSTDSYSFLVNAKSSTLKDATYEEIQWYLVRFCDIDILTDEQRELFIEEKKKEAEKKKKEEEQRDREQEKRNIYAFKCVGIILLFLFAIFSIKSCIEYKKEHPTIRVTKEENKVAVDLGLSVKWATCNVGANAPEEYGNYYGWGEPTGTDVFKHDSEPPVQLIQRFPKRKRGIDTPPPYSIINSTYDIAHQNWGGNWRMSTKQEAQELLDRCRVTFTSLNGKKVVIVTGPNGKSISFPSAGFLDGTGGNWRLESDKYSVYIYLGELYFSVSYEKYAENSAAFLFIGDSYSEGTLIKDKRISDIERYRMLSVRPVMNK